MPDYTEPMRGPCWAEDRAQAILHSVALANNVPEFLAIHQPIRDFRISTTTGQSIEPTDEGLLADLANPETRHAFCVIEGEPGAGKSHLIRWLQVKWTAGDLLMLIERADGSLTGTLRQLRDQLGQKYAHLFTNLAQSVEATFDGRVRLFHASLTASLSPDFFTTKLGDEDWCGTWDLVRLIGNPTVQERWPGPARILNVMSGDGGQRNSASASFDLDDVISLTQVQSATEGLPPKPLMLMRKLTKECDRIKLARHERSSHDLLLDADIEIPESRKLLAALNQRRNFAVQPILGISVDGLKDMFLKLRKELLADSRRLVLLLEDVTSWEGIDGQLIDSLAVDARTRPDVCDMISVVGMTPLYFKDLQGNYGGRISHVVRLGRQREGGGFQETIQLVENTAQIEFAARYLRAVRIEKSELDAWYAEGANPQSVPNKCDSCPRRDHCFTAFGSDDGVGLFPFNRNAVTNIFEKLEDPKGSQSLQTPRGMIQGVLSPILLNPAGLDEGAFPPIEIELSEWMPERKLQPSGYLHQIIDAVRPDPERRHQLRRLAMLWGDPSREITVTLDQDGQRYFSGIAEGIFEAFELPWLGEGLEETKTQSTRTTKETVPPITGETTAEEDSTNRAEPLGVRENRRPPPGTRTDPSGRTPAAVSKARLKALVDQAQAWRDGKPISDPTAWEQLLADLMRDVRALLPDPAPVLWDRVFTKEAVKLEGSGRTDARHFVIPREGWATRGIEAYLSQRQGGAIQPIQRESDLRAIARLLRRLAEMAQTQLNKRLAMEPQAWSIPGAIAQILLARAWLRGAVSPLAPLAKQFEELLSSEQEARSAPTERVESWAELIKATDYYHEKFRIMLRDLLKLPLGTGAPLYDAGVMMTPLADLRATFRTTYVPDKAEFTRGLEDISKLIDLTKQTDTTLRQIPSREAKSLADRKRRVLTFLRQTSLSHHVRRVDDALEGTATALVQAAPVELGDYFKSRQKIDEAKLLDEGSQAWAELKSYLLEDEPAFENDADRLNHVLSVPIPMLRPTLEALDKAEAAILAAYKYASAYVNANQSEGDLSTVHAFGERLAEAGEALLVQLRESA